MSPATVVTPPHVAAPLRLAPFRALRLAPSRVGAPSFGRQFARPYRDVSRRLDGLRERGHLTQDAVPGLHLHEYTGGGITIRGLVGALDVSRRASSVAERAVLPHEGIYPAQADDLADRMTDMALNPAPILLVQSSPPALRALLAQQRRRPPDQAFVDRAGQAHRLWSITDAADLRLIDAHLAPTSAVIADGHHRYAAYLRMQQRDPGGPGDRGLAMLVDQGDTPLFLGAIHRVLVGSSILDVEAATRSLGVTAEPATHEAAVSALGPSTIVATDTESWLVIHLDPHSDRVEVEDLHERLVPALAHGPHRIGFHHAVSDALAHAGPDVGTAVLLPALGFDQVRRIVLADRLFPEKATSFQPKPPLGALFRSLLDEPAAPG